MAGTGLGKNPGLVMPYPSSFLAFVFMRLHSYRRSTGRSTMKDHGRSPLVFILLIFASCPAEPRQNWGHHSRGAQIRPLPRLPFWTKIKEIGAKYVPSRNIEAKRQERAMRELMGKIPTKDPNVTEVVYLSEIVRCLECQRTVPMGIEVVTEKKIGDSKSVLKRQCYCRAHGYDYEARLQGPAIRPNTQRRPESG